MPPTGLTDCIMKSITAARVATLIIVAALAIASASAALRAAGPSAMSVPGRASANVTLAADGSFVALAWAASTPDGTTDIYLASSRDAGATFRSPVRVNSTAGDARASGEQPPRIALVARPGSLPEIAIVWLAKH